MCNLLEKWFFKFYPTTKKVAETAEGDWIRRLCVISTIIHLGLFVFCLALVGFGAMIFNCCQIMMSYSVYLTLREREMALYILLLLG